MEKKDLGLVVQSMFSLTKSLVEELLSLMFTKSFVLLLKNCEELLQLQKFLTIFSAKNVKSFCV